MDVTLAYIDPGSGSLLIQALIATVIALPVLFRAQVARIVRVIRRRPETEPDVTTPSAAGDDRTP